MNATPADCALVVALPLDRERFLDDLARGPHSNFAHNYQLGIPGQSDLAPERIWDRFKRFAEQAHGVISEAAGLGVHVVPQAKLKDFVEVLPRFKATTLFAHSRPPFFLAEDIVDTRKLLAEMQANNSPFFRRLLELVGEDSASLARFLSDVIAPERNVSDAEKTPGQVTEEQMAWHDRRKSLDSLLPGAFQGGAAVEFADGWHLVDEITEVIPAEYAGALDLTVCNSTILAENIRRKCPRSLPLANEQEASTHFRFAVYRQLLRELKRKPQPYEDAAFAIRQKLVAGL